MVDNLSGGNYTNNGMVGLCSSALDSKSSIGGCTKLQPCLESRATLDWLTALAFSETFAENLDQNQFQPINTNNEHGALQRYNIARNGAIPNGEAQTKYTLSTYTDDEKRWLNSRWRTEKGTGFMLR